VAKANLARVVPLVAQNALSQKERDDAIGNEKEAEAAVIAAKGQVQTAELNLSYTTITAPVDGTVVAREPAADGSLVVKIDAPASVLRYVVYKGSVAVDGISMAVTQRSEFAAVIQRSGGQVQGLITQLREKTTNSAPR